jgi:nucleoside-diphosphate-sugar epimerase
MNTRKKYLVTGGTGFIGSALVRALIVAGHAVRVLDDGSRGSTQRLADLSLEDGLECVEGDVRRLADVERAVLGVDAVLHLAAVNGTEFFYTKPDLVLEVAVKGMVNVLDACESAGLSELFLASSSEVYQTPPEIPTDEAVPLVIPDPLNPRYSYAGGKIISELLALNYGLRSLARVVVFRPHNVFGPDMGGEHVLPQLITRLRASAEAQPEGPLELPIQGDGSETRAFLYIEDFIRGLFTLLETGQHREIYHIGTMEETMIADAARAIAVLSRREVKIVPGPLREGSSRRRCPDTAKMTRLGWKPTIPFNEGLRRTFEWYWNVERAPSTPAWKV